MKRQEATGYAASIGGSMTREEARKATCMKSAWKAEFKARLL